MTMTDTQVLMWGTMSFDALGLCGQGHNWVSLVQEKTHQPHRGHQGLQEKLGVEGGKY